MRALASAQNVSHVQHARWSPTLSLLRRFMSPTTTPAPVPAPRTVEEDSDNSDDYSRLGLIGEAFWIASCVLTLGYANKYLLKIQGWEVLDPSYKDPTYEAYSIAPLSSKEMGLKTSLRAKQQKEWDRLSTILSVITATSAAALAIPSPFSSPNIYWVSFACYSAAFGLSLQGLILLSYLTVFAASSSTETVGRVARGKSFLHGLVGPVAFVVSLPTTITTYSSLFLLIGLLSMIIVKGRGESIEEHEVAFNVIVLVPVCLMLVCVLVAVIGGEVVAREEAKKRATRRRQQRHGDGVSTSGASNTKEIQTTTEVVSEKRRHRLDTTP